jgi:Flp pilus assembly pilin Flp
MLKLFIFAQTRVMDAMDSIRENEKGQTMAEYGVVLAVITLAIVATLTLLAGGINGALGRVTSKLG